jgi:UDP-glucose 4-epimerase
MSNSRMWVEKIRAQMQGRRVLVVGGNGFLGRNFVNILAASGACVTATGEGAPFGGVRWTGRLDMADAFTAKRVIEGQEIVVDCIGNLGAAASNLQPVQSLEQELRPQMHLIMACAESDASPLLLLTSSRLVYGTPLYLPVDEKHPLQPASIYAVHKVTAESYARVICRSMGLRFCIFRLANPYGPHQKREAKSYGIINHFLQRAAAGEAIDVYGRGRQERDYVFVEDVVQAMLRCALEPRCEGETFNLGSGEGLPLGTAAELASRLAGSPAVRFLPWPEEDLIVETGDYVSDISLLRAMIGEFHPIPFEEGARLSIEHYRCNGTGKLDETRCLNAGSHA